MEMLVIGLIIAIAVVSFFSYLIYEANTPKCKKCGKRGEGIQIQGGYNRKYKCEKCGEIREESGLDY